MLYIRFADYDVISDVVVAAMNSFLFKKYEHHSIDAINKVQFQTIQTEL